MNMKSAMHMAALVAVVTILATAETEARAIPSRHLDKRAFEWVGKIASYMRTPTAATATTADDGVKAASQAAAATADDTAKVALPAVAGAADDTAKVALPAVAGAADDTAKAALPAAAGAADDTAKAALPAAADAASAGAPNVVASVAKANPRFGAKNVAAFAGGAVLAGGAVGVARKIGGSEASATEETSQQPGNLPGPVPNTSQPAGQVHVDQETGLSYILDSANNVIHVQDPETKAWMTHCYDPTNFDVVDCPAEASATQEGASATTTPTPEFREELSGEGEAASLTVEESP